MSTLPSPRTWLVSTAFSNVTHASGSRNNMVPIIESPLVFPLTFMVLKEKELPLWKEDICCVMTVQIMKQWGINQSEM